MSRSRTDLLLAWVVRICGLLCAAVLMLLVAFLVKESLPALRRVGLIRFFTDGAWHPAANGDKGSFGLLPMLWGTLLATIGALLLSGPLALASALFVNFYAPRWLARLHRRIVELLAGIPSVVYGFWGLVVLVPLIASVEPPGSSLLAGICILSIMILPTIALTADVAMSAVPSDILRGAAALGVSRWRTIREVVLAASAPGLLAGAVLGTGRAIGETMAVLMVCGNVVRSPHSLFDPIRTLTANIALEMAFAMGDHRAALFVSGLLLLAIIVVLVAAAELLSRGRAFA